MSEPLLLAIVFGGGFVIGWLVRSAAEPARPGSRSEKLQMYEEMQDDC